MTASPGRSPVGYTLRVDGRLDPRWADWFDGFTITGESDGTTTLAGVVADQAQLHGVLAKIRDLGVALISLKAASDCGIR
ncbi:MAG: hypothetical protein WAS07_08820 [Micropruina sp.]